MDHCCLPPHIRAPHSRHTLYARFFLSMCPALVSIAIVAGTRALMLLVLSAALCFAVDLLFFRGRDLCAVLYGLVFALMLPVSAPLWAAAAGGAVTAAVLGLTGKNGLVCVHPSAFAAVLLHFLYSGVFSGTQPLTGMLLNDLSRAAELGLPGLLPAAALFAGGLFLILFGIVRFTTPVLFFTGLLAASAAAGLPPLQLVDGPAVFAAFFIAGDCRSTPIAASGRALSAGLCGVLLVLFRMLGAAGASAAAAVLAANLFVLLFLCGKTARTYKETEKTMFYKIRPILNVAAILALCTALLFGMRFASRQQSPLTREESELLAAVTGGESFEPLEPAGGSDSAVLEAYRADTEAGTVGYAVLVRVQGYGGPMDVMVGVSRDGDSSTGAVIWDSSEDPGRISLLRESDFMRLLRGAPLPLSSALRASSMESGYRDGSYRSDISESGESGYLDFVDLTVVNGRIASAKWDALSPDTGFSRRETDSGFDIVAEDAERMLLEAQSADVLSGNPDLAVYAELVCAALESAEYKQAYDSGGEVDLVTGATVTSQAVLDAANLAGEYIRAGAGDQ